MGYARYCPARLQSRYAQPMGAFDQSCETLLGVGLYSFADAARFIGADAREVRRWMAGYSYRDRDGEKQEAPPLWMSQLNRFDVEGVGFRDLLELRFVKKFRKYGLSMPLIRIAIKFAREQLKTDHPFQCKSFRTDGRSIFALVMEEAGDESLIDIARKQQVFSQVVGRELYDGIDFDQLQRAIRWYPTATRAIVLDPSRTFGQPILARSGVPTIAVAEALAAEGGDRSRVARLFDITTDDVRRAESFEKMAKSIESGAR